MAQLNFRVQNALAGTFRAMDEANAAAATVGGWKVGKSSAGLSAELTVGVEATGFTSNTTTPKPSALITGASPNAWRSVNPYTGDFDTTAWSIKVAVRSVSTAFSGTCRARVRVFASVNADGSSARELTAATQVGTTAGPGSTSADVISTVTWTPASAISLSNEYIFIAVAWEIVTASGSNNADADIRTGSSGTTTGSNILTGNFTAPTPKSGTDTGSGADSGSVALQKVTGTARISLAAIGTPVSPDSTNTSIHVRARKANSSDSGTLVVSLYQGATLIESYSIALTDSFATDAHALANVASINDWTTLEIRLQGVSASAHDNLTPQVSYIDLAAPVGSGTPISSSDSGTITEIASPLSQETSADVGTTNETIHPFVRSLPPDTGAGTEAASLSAPLVTVDTNSTTTESASISAVNPVSASDANSIVTEAGSARVVESATDTNGTPTEITATKLSGADANSTTTDSAAPAVGISTPDANGVVTESAGTGSPVAATDSNGTAVEAIQLLQVAQPTDSNGAVAEATAIRFSDADGNSATTESASAGSPVAVTDTDGAVTESAGFSARTTAQDAGSASLESPSLTARPISSDASSTTEAAGISSIPVSGSDTGTDSEISGVVSSLSAAQAATAAESASTGQVTPISGSDSTPHGSETASVGFLAPGGSQGGSAQESASVVVLAASGDTAGLIEQATALVRMLAAESGTVLDDEQITVIALPQDAGSSAESSSILQSFLDTDAAQGIEAFQIIRTAITGLPGTDHLLLSTQIERGQVMSAIGEKGEIEDAARVPEKAQLIGAKLRG